MAELAALALRDDEVERMAKDLDSILSHIDKLNELDTSGCRADGAGSVRCGRDGDAARGSGAALLGECRGARERAGFGERVFQGSQGDRTVMSAAKAVK